MKKKNYIYYINYYFFFLKLNKIKKKRINNYKGN